MFKRLNSNLNNDLLKQMLIIFCHCNWIIFDFQTRWNECTKAVDNMQSDIFAYGNKNWIRRTFFYHPKLWCTSENWQLSKIVTLETGYLQSESLLFSQVVSPQCHLHLCALIQGKNLQLQQDVMSWAEEQQHSEKHVYSTYLSTYKICRNSLLLP